MLSFPFVSLKKSINLTNNFWSKITNKTLKKQTRAFGVHFPGNFSWRYHLSLLTRTCQTGVKLTSDRLWNEKEKKANDTIHVFSLASGHLYERFLKIMMLSVVKNTQSNVKFWLLANFLSPGFKVDLHHCSASWLTYWSKNRTPYPLWQMNINLSMNLWLTSGPLGCLRRQKNRELSGRTRFYF